MTHRSPLAWLHFGDLHVTTASAPNHQDLAALVDEANRGLAGALDFALLPGDSAENGTEAQFRLVRAATGRLALPLRIVPGDHDVEPGSLAAFHVALGAPALPFAERRPGTATVDMGHTHYNELANDGRTIYAATRSTGQIEEGPPGFSVMAVDGGAVSWRFRPLGDAWPFVLVTSPADERLRTVLSPELRTLRAMVLGPDAPVTVAALIDDRPGIAMTRNDRVWQVDLPALDPGSHRATVHAETSSGEGRDTILFTVGDRVSVSRHADGSDADRIAPWPERHLLGTQLGPNRNGRKW